MADYIIQGKKGNGKSLVAVNRMKECLQRGSPVATNLDLYLVHMFNKTARNLVVMRLPDKPTTHDLVMIGRGTVRYDESKNGALVLDECATWFNARSWAEKARKETIDYIMQTRKIGWDMYLLIQSVNALDAQARESCGEHIVTCSRLDRVAIPYLGSFLKMITGSMPKLPRVHSARVIYNDLFSDRWVYRGVALFKAYDTQQVFKNRGAGPQNDKELEIWRKFQAGGKLTEKEQEQYRPLDDDYFGTHCLLTPWHTHGRYIKPWDMERVMRLTKVYWKRFSVPVVAGVSACLAVVGALLAWPFLQGLLEVREKVATEEVREEIRQEVIAEVQADPVEAVQAEASPTMEQIFAGFRITAHVRNETKRYYLISNGEGQQFTDAQLVSMGHRVFFVNECELMLASAVDMSDKVEVFQQGCTPVKTGRQLVDLASMPSSTAKVESLVPVAPYGSTESESGPVGTRVITTATSVN